MRLSSELRIDRILGHVVECGLDFTYSTGTWSRARSVIWEIHAGAHVGLGESSMATGESGSGFGGGDDPSDWSALQRMLEPRVARLLGRNALESEAILEPMPQQRDPDLMVIREALSIALYDLVGCASGLPVHALLGGMRRSEMPGMPVIHVGPIQVMARRAQKWAGAGYRYLKVKFRGELGEDVEALKAIRVAVGADVRLAIDANAGYQELEEALRAIEALRPCGVEYFEDMLDADDGQIAQLRRLSKARIMVDRQAWWPHVHEVVAAGAADVINHHPNNQGGLGIALQIDAVATAAGLETAIGSSGVFGIQDAAFMQLGTVIGLTRPCEDIGMMPYYSGPTAGEYAFDREPCVISTPYPIRSGMIGVSSSPGLGVELDPERLAACEVGQIEYV